MDNPLSPTHKGAAFHPMMIIAAVAVILFCLAGTAALMGWIPSSIGGNRTDRQLSEADRNVLASRMQDGAAQPGTQNALAASQQTQYAPGANGLGQQYAPSEASGERVADRAGDAGYRTGDRPAERAVQREPVQLAQAQPAKNWCNHCGNVESVRTITTRAQGSGVGAAGGAILGGLLGNQVGSGHGRQLATVAGAVGGAVVGNQVEGNMKAAHSYEIRVRLDDGSYRTFHQQSVPGWQNGDRVKVVNGSLHSVN